MKTVSDNYQQLYLIGELAEISSIPAITLRYYDKIGLLKPDHINPETNYRYYSRDQLVLVLLIKYYKRLGFTLKDIRDLFVTPQVPVLEKRFLKKVSEIDAEILRLEKKKQGIYTWYQLLADGDAARAEAKGLQKGHPVVKKSPACQAILASSPADDEDSEIIINRKIVKMSDDYDLYAVGPVIFAFDDLQDRISGDYDVVNLYVPVYPEEQPAVVVREIPAFTAATLMHFGEYDNIGDTYNKLLSWCEEKQINIQGNSLEKYLIDPWSTVNKDEYVTEVCFPINEKESPAG